ESGGGWLSRWLRWWWWWLSCPSPLRLAVAVNIIIIDSGNFLIPNLRKM
ncbi:hypothetical protein A2U01_0060896, partial [Trifolium medium]|nr:hypothetical protein [Trifolium medium]